MREILFRGKRVDNGEWVMGYMLMSEWNNSVYIVTQDECNYNAGGSYFDGCIEEVIPETVGQYTGLTDKDGKKIFEGDIVKGKHNWRIWKSNYDGDVERCFFEQKIKGAYGKYKSEEWAMFEKDRYFCFRNYAVEYYARNGGYRVRNGGQFHELTQSYSYNRDFEIIGNIHDNPELLKGEADER